MMRARASLTVLSALAAIAASTPASAGNFSVVYSFKGGSDGMPEGALVAAGGMLFGTTNQGGATNCGDLGRPCGTVFSVKPATGVEKIIYSFKYGADGAYPEAGLTAVGGMLYGTTIEGGGGACTDSCGVVFSVNQKTGAEAILYAFKGPNSGDGAYPVASLIAVGGTLYGTTESGGAHGYGTVFSVDSTTGVETVVYSFAGTSGGDGAKPLAGLTAVGGKFYGTTLMGGAHGYGTVFSVDPTTGSETVVHSFAGSSSNDGASPDAGLTAIGGKLYGTTTSGGSQNCTQGCGTVFSVTTKSGAESIVYAFAGRNNGGDGSSPNAGLKALGGTLYGTTSFGGTGSCTGGSGCGTVFSVDRKTGAETLLHVFQGSDGSDPGARLIAAKGQLYGITGGGGASNAGTVFAYVP